LNNLLTTVGAVALAVLLLGSLSDTSRADLVGIEYFDSASAAFPGNGGPLWTGIVDTISNKLRIDTWSELPGHGADFWTPVNMPVIWDAIGSTGASFDVPDTFGLNGIVDFGDDSDPVNDFAFISPVSLQDTDWYAFDPVAMEVDTSQVVNFTLSTVLHAGWGGDAFVHSTNGLTYRTVQPNPQSTSEYDYQMIPLLPTGAQTVVSSTAATSTVTSREITQDPLAAIPEASAFLGVALVGAGCAVGTWTRKKLLAKE